MQLTNQRRSEPRYVVSLSLLDYSSRLPLPRALPSQVPASNRGLSHRRLATRCPAGEAPSSRPGIRFSASARLREGTLDSADARGRGFLFILNAAEFTYSLWRPSLFSGEAPGA